MVGRQGLIAWALGEVANATSPNELPPSIAPAEAESTTTDEKSDSDRLNDVLAAIRPAMTAEPPDLPAIETGRQALLALLEGDKRLAGTAASAIVPYLAAIGTNALETPERLAEAKAKLKELLLLRATTESEEKSLTAMVELLAPLTPPASNDEESKKEQEQREAHIETAAMELLRSYFDDALATPSTDLPDDSAAARAKLRGLKAIREPGEQRRAIAHLLYHLDAHVGINKESRDLWYKATIPPETKPADAIVDPDLNVVRMRATDESLLSNRELWHQRVAAVVGLENYVLTVEAEATVLRKSASISNRRRA